MKSVVIPQVRVEPELRAELEAAVHEDASLSEFVEASARNAVGFRRAQSSFRERGQAAWEHYVASGRSVPTDEVLGKLQSKLNARRKKLSE